VSWGNAVATPAIALDLVPHPCEKYPFVASAIVGTDAHAMTAAVKGHFDFPLMCECPPVVVPIERLILSLAWSSPVRRGAKTVVDGRSTPELQRY
jgi:hypothetical protein